MDHDPVGMPRREFITAVGAGLLGSKVVVSGSPLDDQQAGEIIEIDLSINGQSHRMRIEPRWTLLQVIRGRLGLMGTKASCERGECGACTVLIDGVARYACMTLAVEAQGYEVTTIEGVMKGERLDAVQQAFVDEDGMQCGYCTPGQVMAAQGLLRQNPNPGPEEIRVAMSGNLCRCGAYDHIFKAVQRAASGRPELGGAE
jgi:xanthine dehydrogenase YagT iron-sulfur-binding subunit